MKKAKTLYIFAIVLVAVCVVTVLVRNHQTKTEEIKTSGETVLEISSDDVTALSWDYDNDDGSGSLAFTKTDDDWTYDEDGNFPVNETKIAELLSDFEDLKAAFVIENVEDYGQYGLDNPQCTIKISTEDKDYTITLGDFSTMDSERYISLDDGNVYLVDEDPMEDYELQLTDMIRNDSAPDYDTISTLTFAGDTDYTLTYQKDGGESYNADDVYFADIDGEEQPLDTDLVNSYLEKLSGLELTDYVSYQASEEDLSQYGLDTPKLDITLNYTPADSGSTDEETFVLHVGLNPEMAEEDADSSDEDADAEENSTDDDTPYGYVRVGDSSIIYAVNESTYKKLMMCTYDDLRHQDMYYAAFDQVTQLDVTLNDENYTLTREGKGDNAKWYFDEEEVTITDISDALDTLPADSFTADKENGQQEIAVTLHLDNDVCPELTMTFYRNDGDTCLAVLSDGTRAYVSRDDVVDLEEAVNRIVLGSSDDTASE